MVSGGIATCLSIATALRLSPPELAIELLKIFAVFASYFLKAG